MCRYNSRMSRGPRFLAGSSHERLYSPAVLQLGEFHWHLLKASNDHERRAFIFVPTHGNFGRSEPTELGREMGKDEINWWLTKKETDIEGFRSRTKKVLDAAQKLQKAVGGMKAKEPPTSYDDLLLTLRGFANEHEGEIALLYDYVAWLHARHELAPTILFTYRVWGSTRRGDRWMTIEAADVLTDDVRKILAETVLGLRLRNLCTYDHVYLQIGQEIYESLSDEERADGSKTVDVPSDYAIRRTAWETYDECATYFTEIRDSFRNILLDIEKLSEQQALVHNTAFWRQFISKAIQVRMAEPQVWDFKESLSIWHAQGNGKAKARVDFAQDIASFANARGGVLIVGVSDEPRRVVGVGDRKELENRLQFAKTVIAEQLEYPRDLVTFEQVDACDGESRTCLVIIVAQASEVVGVNDGNGSFTYPERLETGNHRGRQIDILSKKVHIKSDNLDFMSELVQFVRDH